MNVIVITACSSGVATTFLASRGLERAAKRRGWTVTVEMDAWRLVDGGVTQWPRSTVSPASVRT